MHDPYSVPAISHMEGTEANHAIADKLTGPISKNNTLAASALALAVAGCGSGGSTTPSFGGSVSVPAQPSGSTASPTPTPSASVNGPDAKAARFLLRASFAATQSAIDAVKKEGAQSWLRRRMGQSNDESAEDYFAKSRFNEVDDRRLFQSDRLVNQLMWDQLMRGGNSVRKRVAFALSQFFVVSSSPRLRMPWPSQAIGAFWDILNEEAFGNFRDLLEKVCLSPAMGMFLDTIGNRKEDTSTGRVADENFARELMQLLSIGLFELWLDGTNKLRNGEPIETYSNADVEGLAKVFTGYDLDVSGLEIFRDPINGNVRIPAVNAVQRPLTANPADWLRPEQESQHSSQEKTFLGVTIPPGTGARDSLRIALDTLFSHPNVAPFFCKQMIQRLVTSNPSPGYVRRVAQVFENNGDGVRGDLAATFEAILLDEEANSSSTLADYRFGKLREPVIRFIQFGRTFSLVKDRSNAIFRDTSDLLSQSPFRAPSVFNFFSPGYTPPLSVAAANNSVAPEFQIVEETSVASYVNFMVSTVDGRGFWLNGLQPDYSAILPLADEPSKLIDNLSLIVTAGQLYPDTKSTIIDAVRSMSSDEASRLQRIQCAVALVMCSTDYLVQK